MIDLSGTRRDRRHVGDMAPALARYPSSSGLRPAQRIMYGVDANWRAITENYGDYLRSPGVHPSSTSSAPASRAGPEQALARGAAAR